MTEKLDKLSNDILSLLKNHEPERLRNHEICDSLFDSYKYNYKDKKTFGVAVSQKLNLLKALRLITHDDIWYGTPNSKPTKEKLSSEVKPSKLNFFEYLKWRRVYNDAKREERIKELEVEAETLEKEMMQKET